MKLLDMMFQSKPGGPKNLLGTPLPPVAHSNLKALSARPSNRAGYLPRPIKAQLAEFQQLRRSNAYFGAVTISISDHPGFEMLNMNDDQVSSICFYFGRDSFEPLSIYLFADLARASANVFDVGSYTGIFGLTAARANPDASVLCVEPIPHIATRVSHNAELNGLTNLRVENMAVSDSVGQQTLTLYGASLATTGASLVSKGADIKSIGEITVATTTLNDLAAGLNGRLGLMKMDTEGAELKVIAGGAPIFATHKPVLISEVLTDVAVAEQMAAMRPFGYVAHYIDEKRRCLVKVGPEFKLGPFGYGNLIFTASDEDLARAEAAARRFAALPHLET